MSNNIDKLNQLIKESPDNAELYYKRANKYFIKRNLEKSIADCQNAIRINDKFADSYALLSFCYYLLRQNDLALENCNLAISLDKNCYIAYTVRSSLKRNKEQYDDSILDIQMAISLNDKYAPAYNGRGNINKGLKKYDEALIDYNKAIELDNKYSSAFNNRGILYYELKKYDEALIDYNKAIELDNKNAYAYNGRGNLYYELKKYDEALIDYNKVIELDNKYSYAYNNRALLYAALKRYSEALIDYNMAIGLDDKYVHAYSNRGNVYKELKMYDEALFDYSKAIELDNKYTYAYNIRGLLYAALKRYSEAITDYNEAIEIDDKYAAAYNNRGLVYYETNEYKRAINDFLIAKDLYIENGNNSRLQFVTRKIEEIEALLNEGPKENNRIKYLMELIDKAGIEESIRETEKSFKSFISEKQHISNSEKAEFVVLRRWNSYTPIIARNYFSSKGGGYFFKTKNFGIVLDPGFNFIDNFNSYGFKFSEIDHVLITHAHNDHTTDLESIITLLHKYNEMILGSFDDPAEGSIMYEIYSEQDSEITEEDRERIEYLAKQRFAISPRRKRIRLYMTVSTYKKYSALFDLANKNDYDVVIIKAGENIPIINPNGNEVQDYSKGIKITAIYAKHNDIMSDRDSVGFVVHHNEFLLIYTGDTGFDKTVNEQYSQLRKQFNGKQIILLAHIGGFKQYEKRYNVGNFDGGKAFYKNHLGRLGLAKLVETLEPAICVISEFGEEFRSTRCEVADIFQKVYPDTTFIAADIGLCINEEGLIKAISKVDFYKDILEESFLPPEEIIFTDMKADCSLRYYKNGLKKEDILQTLIKINSQSGR